MCEVQEANRVAERVRGQSPREDDRVVVVGADGLFAEQLFDRVAAVPDLAQRAAERRRRVEVGLRVPDRADVASCMNLVCRPPRGGR
jgi:hypothetical protein